MEASMSWVKTFDEKEATGRLAEVYAELSKAPQTGRSVPNIMKWMGSDPKH